MDSNSIHQTQPEEEESTVSEATVSITPLFTSITLSTSLLAPPKPPKPSLSSLPSHLKLPSQITTLSLTTFPSKTVKNTPAKNLISITPLISPNPFNRRRSSDPSFGAAGRKTSIVYFRSDLRVHDNEALTSASNDSFALLPVFLFDPRDFGKSSSGFDKTGPYRARFLIESVKDLRTSLRARGSDLVVRVGKAEEVLKELARAIGADAVYMHKEVSKDEVKVEEQVEKVMGEEGVEVKSFWGSTLYHVEDLPFELEKMPVNYGGFREKVKGVGVRKAIEVLEEIKGLPKQGDVEVGDVPSLSDLGLNPHTVGQDAKASVNASLVGGETEALERLKKFATEFQAQPKTETKNNGGSARDSIYGANFSCKISPWLATGCLSPRFMFEELKKTAARSVSASSQKNDDNGMNWLTFELLWRDFFRFITKKYSSTQRTTQAVPAMACT